MQGKGRFGISIRGIMSTSGVSEFRQESSTSVGGSFFLRGCSYLNLLASVRRVTQVNKGKKTAGVDGELAPTSKSKIALVNRMGKHTLWKVKPARRVYIPKPGKPGQERPLGIPTIRNRVSQAMMENAYEPHWEALFESNSYGFRPGRSIHDAIEHCWLFLRGSGKRSWILDADIKGAFDNISHDHILKSISHLPGRELIKQWLKAGYVEAECFHETDSGTPQAMSEIGQPVRLRPLKNTWLPATLSTTTSCPNPQQPI